MISVTQELKNVAVNGIITLENALKIAKAVDRERQTSKDLLKQCEKNVGMHLGEDINTHIAGMEGTYFNSRDYHSERMPGEQ